MGFVIDQMCEDDLDQVVALEQTCGLNSRGIKRYRLALSDPLAVMLVALSEMTQREVIGLLSATVVLDELQIDNIAVTMAWRRRRVASELLFEGLKSASHKGALNAVLELRSANSSARTLYERHAFLVVGRRQTYYHDPSDDGLIMTCDIVNSLAIHAEKNLIDS